MYSTALSLVLLMACLLFASSGCASNDNWGRASVTRNGQDWQVTLENNQLFVQYSPARTNGLTKDRITEFRLKNPKRIIATALDGRHGDKDQAFFRMSDASVTGETADRKTVRLVFDKRVEHVSILKDMPVIEIKYEQGGHNLDYRITGDTYVFFGEQAWQASRGWDKKHPTLRDEYDPTGSYYRAEWGGPSILGYKGWMIMGFYDSQTGLGVGMILPANVVRWIKLVAWGRLGGFERWMVGKHRSYLYAVTGGAEEILSMGKKLAETVPK